MKRNSNNHLKVSTNKRSSCEENLGSEFLSKGFKGFQLSQGAPGVLSVGENPPLRLSWSFEPPTGVVWCSDRCQVALGFLLYRKFHPRAFVALVMANSSSALVWRWSLCFQPVLKLQIPMQTAPMAENSRKSGTAPDLSVSFGVWSFRVTHESSVVVCYWPFSGNMNRCSCFHLILAWLRKTTSGDWGF